MSKVDEALDGWGKKRYKVIYADPPWTYSCWSKKGEGRTAQSHYDVMSIDDICDMDVESISEDDSVCVMWVTFPLLNEGLRVLKEWGFTYKTVPFVWIKTKKSQDLNQTHFSPVDIIHDKMGMGYYTRANAEMCILGVKGKGLRVLSHSVRQACISNIREHSRKPDDVRDRIVELFGDVPRIELFSRTITKGWDVFGNELEKYGGE